MPSARIAAALFAVTATVGCGAPVNDYVSTAYMLRFGEEQRRTAGRTVGEIVVPSDAQRTARLAIPEPDNDVIVLERLADE